MTRHVLVFLFLFCSKLSAQNCDTVLYIHHTYHHYSQVVDYGFEIDSLQNGQVITRADSFGIFQRNYYDGAGRLSGIIHYNTMDSISYTYDASSHLTATEYWIDLGNGWQYGIDSARSEIHYKPNGKDSLYVRFKWNNGFVPIYKNVFYYDAYDTLYKWQELQDTGSGFYVTYTRDIYYINGLRVDTGYSGTAPGYQVAAIEYDSLGRIKKDKFINDPYWYNYTDYTYQCNQLQHTYSSCSDCHSGDYYDVTFDYDCKISVIISGFTGMADEYYDRYDYFRIDCHSIDMIITDDIIMCNDDSVYLSAIFLGGTAPYTYSWTPAAGLAFADSLETRASPDTTTDYILTITDTFGVTVTDTLRVTVMANPYSTLHVSGIDTTSVCQSAILSTDSLPGFTFRWYFNHVGTPVTDAHMLAINNGTYSVRIWAGFCQWIDDSIHFNGLTNPPPVVTITQLCNGSLAASTSKPSTVDWYYNDSILVATNTDTLIVPNDGTFTAVATDSSGCVSSKVRYSYYTQNLYNYLHKTDACQGTCSGELQLQANFTNIVWSNGGTQSIINALCPGPYFVSFTDGKGCSQTLYDTIQTYPLLQVHNVTVPASDSITCDGIAMIVDSSNNTSSFAATWPVGTSTIVKKFLCTGWYIVDIRPNVGQCLQKDSVFIGYGQVTDTCSAILDPHGISCYGQHDAFIQASSSTGNPVGCIWTTPDAHNYYVSKIINCQAGLYTCIVIDSTGCRDTATVTLIEPSQIAYSVSTYHWDCADSCVLLMNVTGGTPPYSYLWCTNSTQSFAQTCDPLCQVTVTDHNSCTFTATAHQTPYPGTLNVLIYTTSCPTCNDGSIKVFPVGGVPPYTITCDGIAVSDSITGLTQGNHLVCINDAAGCQTCDSVFVTVLNVVTELRNDEIFIYPNPAKDKFTIKLPADLKKVQYEISDLTGRVLAFEKINGPIVSLNANYSPGIYRISIFDNKTLIGKKILVIN